jgi:hypothetical protein
MQKMQNGIVKGKKGKAKDDWAENGKGKRGKEKGEEWGKQRKNERQRKKKGKRRGTGGCKTKRLCR